MLTLFSTLFLIGLLLNVYLLIRGTERWKRNDLALRLDAFGRQLLLGRVSVRIPMLAAFCSTLGLTGYILSRTTGMHLAAICTVAALTAGGAMASAIVVVKRWAVPQAARAVSDERFLLQGQVARVTTSISDGIPGEVAYEIDGRRFTCSARTVDGTPLASGADAVIERVEDDVVFVEDWTRVERRL